MNKTDRLLPVRAPLLTLLLLFLLIPSCSLFRPDRETNTVPPDRQELIRRAKLHYDDRLGQFKKENLQMSSRGFYDEKGPIILLGDSHFERFKEKDYFPQENILNRGISSDHIEWDSSRGIVFRLSPDLLAPAPGLIIVQAGVNDLGDDDSPAHIDSTVQTYETILLELRRLYPKSLVASFALLPAGGKFARLNPAIASFNKKIFTLTASMGINCYDLSADLADSSGALSDCYSADKLHLNNDGYSLWSKRVRSIVKTHLP